MRPRFSLAVLGAACVAIATACGCGPTAVADRTFTDPARGVRFTIPDGWILIDNEARSPGGSLLEIRVYDVKDADRAFLARLPGSMFRKLEDWTRFYFIIDGKMTYVKAKVGSVDATQLDHPVRMRPGDPLTLVNYWIVRRGDRLFVLRAAYAPHSRERDQADVKATLGTFEFLETGRGEPLGSTGDASAPAGEVKPPEAPASGK